MLENSKIHEQVFSFSLTFVPRSWFRSEIRHNNRPKYTVDCRLNTQNNGPLQFYLFIRDFTKFQML